MELEMDKLDRISIWAIVIIIVSSFIVVGGHLGEAKPERKDKMRMIACEYAPVNGELIKKVKLTRNLMESGSLEKAEMLTEELIGKYPYEGEPHMLMGDVLMRRQEAVKAMPHYKEAIELNPDYLDKKTSLFQGKKLKVAVEEALLNIDKVLERNPADDAAKSNRKMIYYLQRKIAGSCG
jgi:tetratricopeptide (TPR) repeat protein